MLRILSEHQLYVKLSKCQFGVLKVGYLGHLISFEGVAVDPTKIHSVQHFPVPTSLKVSAVSLGWLGTTASL